MADASSLTQPGYLSNNLVLRAKRGHIIMRRTLIMILFMLLSCVGNYGQGSGDQPEWYFTLIPGQSTKKEVEKLLGQPLKTVSETLFEYEPARSDPSAKIVIRTGPNTDPTYRLYIQYRKGANV